MNVHSDRGWLRDWEDRQEGGSVAFVQYSNITSKTGPYIKELSRRAYWDDLVGRGRRSWKCLHCHRVGL